MRHVLSMCTCNMFILNLCNAHAVAGLDIWLYDSRHTVWLNGSAFCDMLSELKICKCYNIVLLKVLMASRASLLVPIESMYISFSYYSFSH